MSGRTNDRPAPPSVGAGRSTPPPTWGPTVARTPQWTADTIPGVKRPAIGHAELADLLRAQILSGQLPPGAPIPSDRYLRETHGVGRDTVRDAITVLRYEGLIVRRQGRVGRVRQAYERQPIPMAGVVRVDVRMPTPQERDALPDRMEVGVPVWVVTYTDGRVVLLPGDRWTVPGPGWTAS